MILIYTHKTNNRIKYVFNLIFRDLLQVNFSITNNTEDFLAYEGPKLNYSFQSIGNELFFLSCNLLFETGIKQQKIDHVLFDQIKCPFPLYKQSQFPFDPFAAIFYLTTRYEEYLPYKKDAFDRFDASESITTQLDFLKKPVVDIWTQKIAIAISEKYPSFIFPKKNYKFIPTIDIDSAWAYKEKGIIRSLLGYIKSFTKFNFPDILERSKVLSRLLKDPFDTFDLKFYLQKKYNLSPLYFILFAEYAQYDKNISIYNRKFQSLIKSIDDYAVVGIHPSFKSNSNLKKLNTEITQLSNVLKREVTKSRQHFLKLSFPSTYRTLIEADILEDYSLGFASATGFRAGICNPFHFYDIDLEKETNLKLYPFAVMDGTLRDYNHIEAKDAISHIKPLIDEVKAVNGTFISLWHNESLSNQKRWVGWDVVYEEMIKLALP